MLDVSVERWRLFTASKSDEACCVAGSVARLRILVVVTGVWVARPCPARHTHFRPANENCRHSRYRPGVVIIASTAIYALPSRVLRLLSTFWLQLLTLSRKHPQSQPLYDSTKPSPNRITSSLLARRLPVQSNTYRIEISVFNAATHETGLEKIISPLRCVSKT